MDRVVIRNPLRIIEDSIHAKTVNYGIGVRVFDLESGRLSRGI